MTSPRTCSQTEAALLQVVTVLCRENEAVTSDGEDRKKEATTGQQSVQEKDDPCPDQRPHSTMLDHPLGMIGSSYISLSHLCHLLHYAYM